MSTTVVINGPALHDLLASPTGDVARDLLRRAIAVDRMAKQLAPVDTGRLRASINNKLASDGAGIMAVIGTNVEYALHQEFGTRYQSGTPFLRPALAAATR